MIRNFIVFLVLVFAMAVLVVSNADAEWVEVRCGLSEDEVHFINLELATNIEKTSYGAIKVVYPGYRNVELIHCSSYFKTDLVIDELRKAMKVKKTIR